MEALRRLFAVFGRKPRAANENLSLQDLSWNYHVAAVEVDKADRAFTLARHRLHLAERALAERPADPARAAG